MRQEFPGRCPGLVYDAPSGLLDIPEDQTFDRPHLSTDCVTDPN
jgi:hypothetical protein